MDDRQDPAHRGRLTRRWRSVAVLLGSVIAFVASRQPYLDADIPQWELSQYSPIDEFAYTVPAFNLHHYGTWVHQAAPWAPLEGLPLNIAENVAAAISMWLVGYDYWGLRASSLAFGLVAFLCLVAIVRRQAVDAIRHDHVPAWLGMAVTSGAIVLLLLDFSSLLSARIIEPTVTRLAVAAGILYLVSRGTFLGDRHGLPRSGVFGVVVGASVIFVYIYNLFLLPAAGVALAWWAFRHDRWAGVVRHSAAFLFGVAVSWTAYFLLMYGVYDQSPLEWYRVWIGSFGESSRASGVSLTKALTVLDGNIFRLDPAFLALFLVSLPVFVWTAVRRPQAVSVLIGAGLVFLVAQTAVVADYPARKGLMMILFALPIAACGVLSIVPFRAWVGDHRGRLLAALGWLVVALGITWLELPLRPTIPHGSILVRIVQVAAVAGMVAIVIVATTGRRPLVIGAMAAFGLAVVAPLTYVDLAFVYRHPTFTYRDALIEVRPDVDGRQTAGGWSFGMQLDNTSRAVLNAYFYGVSRADYERDVVRMFSEGLATSMFDYVDDTTRTHWESLGFRVVDTYHILLPRGQILGRYVFEPVSRGGGIRPT